MLCSAEHSCFELRLEHHLRQPGYQRRKKPDHGYTNRLKSDEWQDTEIDLAGSDLIRRRATQVKQGKAKGRC